MDTGCGTNWNYCLINLPQADASWFQTADKLRAPNWPTMYNSASYNRQTGNHTYLSCRNLILEEHENLVLNCTGAEASPSPSLGVNAWWVGCSFGLQMWLIGLVNQLSVHIWQDGDHRAGSQGRQSWTDQQIWLPGISVSVVHDIGVYF